MNRLIRTNFIVSNRRGSKNNYAAFLIVEFLGELRLLGDPDRSVNHLHALIFNRIVRPLFKNIDKETIDMFQHDLLKSVKELEMIQDKHIDSPLLDRQLNLKFWGDYFIGESMVNKKGLNRYLIKSFFEKFKSNLYQFKLHDPIDNYLGVNVIKSYLNYITKNELVNLISNVIYNNILLSLELKNKTSREQLYIYYSIYLQIKLLSLIIKFGGK